MKNTIAKALLTALIILALSPCGFAQENPLTGLTIKDGWMTGTVTAHFGVGYESEFFDEIKVDCPEPPEAYPAEILTVSKGHVSKKQMQQALKAAGQSIEGRFVNPRGSAIYTGDWNAKANADISNEDAAAQAIEIALKYFEALGVKVDPIPKHVSRPYDYDAWMDLQQCSYEHRYSDTSTFIENAKAQWKRTSKHHPKQSEYTTVSFYISLDGMRLDRNPGYPAGYEDEPDAWEGFSISADATVSDSGILVEASCDLLEITSRRPLENDPVYESFLSQHQTRIRSVIAADHWQAALECALADSGRISLLQRNSEDSSYRNQNMDTPIIAYGSRSVITAIYPVLHTISKNEWAPFWSIVTMREYSDGWRN